MKASDVLIAWTPAECAFTANCPKLRETAGSVVVMPWPDGLEQAQAYARVAGACEESWRAASPEALVASVFVLFNAMVLRDGVNPLTAHVNLMDLDEYRSNVSADLKVGSAAPVHSAQVIDFATFLA